MCIIFLLHQFKYTKGLRKSSLHHDLRSSNSYMNLKNSRRYIDFHFDFKHLMATGKK